MTHNIFKKRRLDNLISNVRDNLSSIGINKNNYKFVTDAEGLQKAYDSKDGLYSYSNRLYVAGTRDANDWMEDIRYIPCRGNSTDLTRYKSAEQYIKDHPGITQVTGHSMGGKVALELQKQLDRIHGTRKFWGTNLYH